MKIKTFLSILLITVFLGSTFGQKSTIKNGEKAYEAKQYGLANTIFIEALKAGDKVKSKSYLAIADAAFRTNNYALASEYYGKVDKKMPVSDMVNHGKVLMALGEYDQASGIFSKAINKGYKNPDAGLYAESCDFSLKGQTADETVQLNDIRLKLNGSSFGSVFLNGQIVFSSILNLSELKDRSFAYNYGDLAIASFDGTRAGSTSLFNQKLRLDLHDGAPTFSSDGSKIYFQHMIQHKRNKNKEYLGEYVYKIFESDFEDGDWSAVGALPFNSTDFTYSCAQPAVNWDGNVMIFASDMPGGEGGWDLYVVRKQGESWGSPENLGTEINTPANEMYPFISVLGELFFASDGQVGFGGLDVFSAQAAGQKWAKVENMGKPINSARNDFGFSINPANSSQMLISTNRAGSGMKDKIMLISHKEAKKEEQKKEVVVNTVVEPETDIEENKTAPAEVNTEISTEINVEKEDTKQVVVEDNPPTVDESEKINTQVILTDKNQVLPANMGLTYHVQIVAMTRPIGLDNKMFKGIKVERKLHNDLYKYISGTFTNREDVLKHLEVIKNKGFKDAFIATFAGAYTNKTLIKSNDDQQINNSDLAVEEYFDYEGLIYRVQFKSTRKPLDKVTMNIDGQYVFRYQYQEMFRYTIGEFEDPQSAIELKNRIVAELGYKDAFVVAFNADNERIVNVRIYREK